jgi:hypothetical protein
MPWDPNNVRPAAKVNDVNTAGMRTDQYLTNFSLAWRQDADQFVAPKASTPVPVVNESDKYAIFVRGAFWRDEAEVRALGGRPVQVGYGVDAGTYSAEEWALEHTIDDRQRRNAVRPFDLDESGTALLEGKQMIRQDRIWATSFFKPGVWAFDFDAGDAGSGVAPFDDLAVDPVATVNSLRRVVSRGSGFKANTVVLGADVIDMLTTHPQMIERVKYTQLGVVTEQLLAQLFRVQNVLVAESMYNAANEVGPGVANNDDFQYIVNSTGMWIGYIEPQPRAGAPTAIARFGWTGLIPGAMNNLGGVITRGRDERAYSDWIHSRNAFDMRIIAPDLGVFIENVVDAAQVLGG